MHLFYTVDREKFDSITITREKPDELQSTKKLPTKAKQTKSMLSFTRPCAKYLHASLEKEKMVIDITALSRKKGSIFPIPPVCISLE